MSMMLTDRCKLRVLGSGGLTAVETTLAAVPRSTVQSLLVAISLVAPEVGDLQVLIKNDPVGGAAAEAATVGQQFKVRTYTHAGEAGSKLVRTTDGTGQLVIPFTDDFTFEMMLPPMLMARSTTFSIGLKLGAAPVTTVSFVALLVQDR